MGEKNKFNWKKIGLKLLYPHLALIICLLPISIALLILSLVFLGTESIIAIFSYVLAFYVLLIICFRVPRIIKFFKTLKHENKFLQRWFSDVHLRINISLYGSLIWNITFAIFQLALGFYFKSFWFYSMFAYYVMLGIIRFYLLKYTRKYKANEQEQIMGAWESYVNAVRNAYPEADEATIIARAKSHYQQIYGTSLNDDVRKYGKSSFAHGFMKTVTLGLYHGKSAEDNIAELTGQPVGKMEGYKKIAGGAITAGNISSF